MIRLIWFLPVLIMAVSCSSPKPVEMAGIDIQSVSPLGTDLKKVLVSAHVKVNNPNPYSIKVWHTEAICKVNGKTVSTIQMDSLIRLNPSAITLIPIQLELETAPILSSGLAMLMGNGIPYTISGTTKAGKGGIKWNVPFEQTGTLTRKDLGQLGF